jgi:GMP synthase-like glutamine amidotransferase
MRALVLQHVAVEGPGTLASYLESRGWTLETVALYEGARLPVDAQEYQAVIVMGGPMGVYDEAEYPFLRDEHRFLTRVLAQGCHSWASVWAPNSSPKLSGHGCIAIPRRKLAGIPSI